MGPIGTLAASAGSARQAAAAIAPWVTNRDKWGQVSMVCAPMNTWARNNRALRNWNAKISTHKAHSSEPFPHNQGGGPLTSGPARVSAQASTFSNQRLRSVTSSMHTECSIG